MARKAKVLELPVPTPDLVRERVRGFDQQGQVTEAALSKLLATFPANRDVPEVLLKVIAINRIYSTSIFAVQPVAEMIVAQEGVDELLAAGDPLAVEQIRRVAFTDSAGVQQDRSIYSFATKYCALHNPAAYAIYDGLVATELWEYQKWAKQRSESFCPAFRWDDLTRYATFLEVVRAFRAHFGLEEFGLRDIDKFLWMQGRERNQATSVSA